MGKWKQVKGHVHQEHKSTGRHANVSTLKYRFEIRQHSPLSWDWDELSIETCIWLLLILLDNISFHRRALIFSVTATMQNQLKILRMCRHWRLSRGSLHIKLTLGRMFSVRLIPGKRGKHGRWHCLVGGGLAAALDDATGFTLLSALAPEQALVTGLALLGFNVFLLVPGWRQSKTQH